MGHQNRPAFWAYSVKLWSLSSCNHVQMLNWIHTTLGLSGEAPRWVRRLQVPATFILIMLAYGAWNMRAPVHVAYHEAKIFQMTPETGGIRKGQVFIIELPEGDRLTIGASLNLPKARTGDLICLQETTDQFRGGKKFSTAAAQKCSDHVTMTYFRTI